jgi:5-(hydroxymethyl)furfural/furfural oxidase
MYDYVILGGGSSGCVLAARLSEDPRASVMLIEAGKDVTAETAPADVLASYPGRAYFNPDFTWPGLTVLLGNASTNDPEGRRRARYEQASILGGGSSINGLIANRGAPSDYDGWEELGAAGWNFASVLPYFRKLERDLNFSDDYHGHDGPITIRRYPVEDWAGFVKIVADVLGQRGLPIVPDQNGKWEDGVMPVPTSIDEHDRRVSCAMAYLTPAVRARTNLTIRTETNVRRILFEGTRATGAEIARGDQTEVVRGREIILACGAIHSPAMLMRSGIGAPDDLARHGIEVVAPLPGVGRNLIEHPSVSVSLLSPSPRPPAQSRTPSHAGTGAFLLEAARHPGGRHVHRGAGALRLARARSARRLALFLRQQGLLAGLCGAALGRSARRTAGRLPHALRPARPRTHAQRVPLRRGDRGIAGARRRPQQDFPSQLFGSRARCLGAGCKKMRSR